MTSKVRASVLKDSVVVMDRLNADLQAIIEETAHADPETAKATGDLKYRLNQTFYKWRRSREES